MGDRVSEIAPTISSSEHETELRDSHSRVEAVPMVDPELKKKKSKYDLLYIGIREEGRRSHIRYLERMEESDKLLQQLRTENENQKAATEALLQNCPHLASSFAKKFPLT